MNDRWHIPRSSAITRLLAVFSTGLLPLPFSAPANTITFAAISVQTDGESSLLDRLLHAWRPWRTHKDRRSGFRSASGAATIHQLSGEEE